MLRMLRHLLQQFGRRLAHEHGAAGLDAVAREVGDIRAAREAMQRVRDVT